MAALRQAVLAVCCIVSVSAATAAGFKFTDAMVESGIVNEADRASLVAWLLANSGAE